MKILFVCRANVGRSQMAEVIFNKLANGKHTATSAGTRVVDKEGKSREGVMLKDILGAREIIDVLNEFGIDVSRNTCKQLTPEILAQADKAIVMAEKDTIPEYLFQSDKFVYWELIDPKGQDLNFTRNTRDQIQGLVVKLINSLT